MTLDTRITTDDSKIIVALDYANSAEALNLARKLDPALCKLKVGKELFTAAGPALVEQLVNQDFKIFLDLKFHDIPNTAAKACAAAAELGVWMLNVHASGGLEMMQAAKDAIDKKPNPPLLIAVTVLTSMNETALKKTGIETDLITQVLRLAQLAHEAKLDGVVCSALETPLLRQHLIKPFYLVTPGIRPDGSNLDDQSRVLTPAAAVKNGSDYLVIGRPITQSADPARALESIVNELKNAPQTVSLT